MNKTQRSELRRQLDSTLRLRWKKNWAAVGEALPDGMVERPVRTLPKPNFYPRRRECKT